MLAMQVNHSSPFPSFSCRLLYPSSLFLSLRLTRAHTSPELSPSRVSFAASSFFSLSLSFSKLPFIHFTLSFVRRTSNERDTTAPTVVSILLPLSPLFSSSLFLTLSPRVSHAIAFSLRLANRSTAFSTFISDFLIGSIDRVYRP